MKIVSAAKFATRIAKSAFVSGSHVLLVPGLVGHGQRLEEDGQPQRGEGLCGNGSLRIKDFRIWIIM